MLQLFTRLSNFSQFMYNKYSDEIFSKLELSLYAIYNE